MSKDASFVLGDILNRQHSNTVAPNNRVINNIFGNDMSASPSSSPTRRDKMNFPPTPNLGGNNKEGMNFFADMSADASMIEGE